MSSYLIALCPGVTGIAGWAIGHYFPRRCHRAPVRPVSRGLTLDEVDELIAALSSVEPIAHETRARWLRLLKSWR